MLFSFEVKDEHLLRFAQRVDGDHTKDPAVAIKEWSDARVDPINKDLISEDVYSDPEVLAKQAEYDSLIAQKKAAMASIVINEGK